MLMRRHFGPHLAAALVSTVLSIISPAMSQDTDRVYRQEVLQLTASDGKAVPSLLSFPKDGINLNAPAVIHCQGGPGASPLEGSGPWIAAGLARHGYTILAPMVRHGDQLFDTDFSDYKHDVKAAVDFLAGIGFRKIILTGSSFGSITITRYYLDTRDRRISAMIHFAPTEDVGPWTQRGMGEAEYARQNAIAGEMISRGATDEIFAPPFNAPPPMPPNTRTAFSSTPQKWLGLWGMGSNGSNLAAFPQLDLPLLLLAGEKDGFNTLERLERLKAAAVKAPAVDILYYPGDVDHSFNSNPPIQPKVVNDVAGWLSHRGLGVGHRVKTEVITITDREPGTRALRYIADGVEPAGAAFLMLHDTEGSALTGPPNWVGEGLAQAGALAIGIHSNRGSRGILGGRYETTSKDIAGWVDYLVRHGHDRVVLVGHGAGATRALNYVVTAKDQRIAGLVLVAPAPDLPTFLRQKLGAEAYERAVADAKARVDSSDYKDYIYLKQVPPGIPTTVAGNLAMTPAAFLDNWGPDAPMTSRLLTKVTQPVLILLGSRDARLSVEDLSRWSHGRRNVATQLYADGDHGLTGLESQGTRDIVTWGAGLGLIAPSPAPSPSIPASVKTPSPASKPGPHGKGEAGTPETAG